MRVVVVCLLLVLPLVVMEAAFSDEPAAEAAIPALQVPPPNPPLTFQPFPALPPIPLDEANNRVGVAQQVAREKGAQGRVFWVDGLANLDSLNSLEKVQFLVKQVAAGGFNTLVLDVKPIPGYVLYPSKIAPRMTAWRGTNFPEAFDPLEAMVTAGHTAGLEVIANLNTFAEGHRLVGKGPGYFRPEWQTTLCEPRMLMVAANGVTIPLATRTAGQAPDPTTLAVYTAASAIPARAGAVVALLDEDRRVQVVMDAAILAALKPQLVKNGSALVGEVGYAADFLRQQARVGQVANLVSRPVYVRSQDTDASGVPLWTNPNDPAVQQRLLDILTEVVTHYQIDGVVFDDRMRFVSVNADMSEASRRAFEAYVGKRLTWPDDVLRMDISYPALNRRATPGPYYEAWLVWRATTIRNWLARAVETVKGIRPTATVGVYVGSWYGEYPAYGSNWAAPDFQAGFRFLTDNYRQTGFANLVDWMTTGCYYSVPTLAETGDAGGNLGFNVEAAGQLSNRCANSATWVYAGLSLDKYDRNPEALARALQAAAASTQGIMVFDLSHKIDQFWPIFKKAFAAPARAPHSQPALMTEVRARKEQRKQAGMSDPPVIILNGAAGTGL